MLWERHQATKPSVAKRIERPVSQLPQAVPLRCLSSRNYERRRVYLRNRYDGIIADECVTLEQVEGVLYGGEVRT